MKPADVLDHATSGSFVTASSHASRSAATRHAALDGRWQISERARDDFRAASTLTRPSATLSYPMGEGLRAGPRLQQEERFPAAD